MATNEQIIKEAEYYLNNKVTIEQASIDLNISKRTLQLHLKKLEEISPLTFALVKAKKEANIHEGNIKGGQIGKRGATWTEEEAKLAAQTIINEQLTYEEAEEKLGRPSSTLHEMLHKGVKDLGTASLLYAIAEANRKGMTLENYLKENKIAPNSSVNEKMEENNTSKRSK